MSNLIAKRSVNIKASRHRIWQALTSAADIKKYLFGTDVATDWKEGSPIQWNGEWHGKKYQDKGQILKVEQGRLLQYTYWSSMQGKEDKPDNYVTVTNEISGEDGNITLTLSQDGNDNEKSRQHAEDNWEKVLQGIKKLCEN